MRIFYRPEQSVATRSFSPSSKKPALLMERWAKEFPKVPVLSFNPVTTGDLCLAHRPAYVKDVMSGRAENGFGNFDPAVAKSLPYTVGSMVAASMYAFQSGENTMSPTSGFHHANWEFGGGFCTFNGLMVAASMVLSAGAEKIAIIDCDVHYGDGTDDILTRMDLRAKVDHWTLGALPPAFHDENLFRGLFLRMLERTDADLVIYQAGADAHEKDPLGGWQSTDLMQWRDRMLFNVMASKGIPVAWNLAGGYFRDKAGTIRPVLDLHTTTMREALRAESLASEITAGGEK